MKFVIFSKIIISESFLVTNTFVSEGISAYQSLTLRGPAAIIFISRDTRSDSIAKLFRACFYWVSHNYRAICCKIGYRRNVPV